jgi:hypothetical protein
MMEKTEKEIFTIDYYLEPSDWIAFSDYYARTSKTNKAITNVMIMAPFATFPFCIALFGIDTTLFAAFSLFLPLLLIQAIVTKLFGNYLTKKAVAEGHNRSIVGRKQIIINEHFIETKGQYGKGQFYWSGVEKVEQNGEYIFIFIATNSAYIIPKKAFVDSETATKFFNAATTYHGKSVGLPAYCEAPGARLFEA